MRSCPKCGYMGEGAHCPNDGEPLQSDETLAEVSVDAHTLAPPPDRTGRRHAPAAAPDDDAQMRGQDYGRWAEPKVKKKTDEMIGRTIDGRYEVIGLLGKGGMGAVYKCRQPAVQRMVALKVLLEELADNETVVKRFHQEALAASRLTHPNTISVYDFGQTEDGVLYIAMEYLRGQSLAQALKAGGAMVPKRVIHIMRQICKSLSEAHKAGIIHRDLKPDNIFLTDIEGEQDFIKVLDFGVAKLKEYEGKEGTLTQAGMIFGTPKYMAPEQARSADMDARADVYALGVILYEMICGKPPFVADNPLAILIAHVNQAPPPFAQMRPDHGVPAAFEAVVMKALSKAADGRHATVDELAEELNAVEAILDGATYESVSHRLPDGAGAGADTSLIGAAIVSPGHGDAAPERIGGGNTVILDGEGAPLSMELDLGPLAPPTTVPSMPPQARPAGPKIGLVLALLIPVVGLAGWYVVGQSGGQPTLSDGGVATAGAPVGTTPERAPEPLDAGRVAAPANPESEIRPDAGKPKVIAPPVEPELVELMVRSSPKGARIKLLSTGEQLGITNGVVKIAEKTRLVLTKRGYYPQRFTVAPGDVLETLVLRAKPRAVSKPVRPKRQPVKPVEPTVKSTPAVAPVRIARPPVKVPEDDPIELQ